MDHLARIRGVFDVFPDYFQGFLEGMAYLGPILDDPRRYYLSWGGQRFTVGTRGEHTPDIISYDEEVRSKVNEWFTRFSIPYQIENRLDVASGELTGELSTLPLRDTRTETIVTPVDVGFGISQILPVIVEAVAGKSKTICVDQPEVHLHPRLQAEIAELLIDTFQNQSKRWIVETHSELLVLRIQTAIAEKRINPSDVSVLYVNPPPEQALQGEGSTIQALEIDEDGDFLSSWPEGFFEDGHAERMARLSSGR
jgi:predicted ATPase